MDFGQDKAKSKNVKLKKRKREASSDLPPQALLPLKKASTPMIFVISSTNSPSLENSISLKTMKTD